jgi:hydrogenase nickel incorporation protein HypA/HybF
MHELSIAKSIVKIAEAEAIKANTDKILRIELEIGNLAGIEIEALNFVWSSAVKGTLLENTIKTITTVVGRAACKDCKHCFSLEQLYDTCPKCGSYNKDLTAGKDLKIKSLELELRP